MTQEKNDQKKFSFGLWTRSQIGIDLIADLFSHISSRLGKILSLEA